MKILLALVTLLASACSLGHSVSPLAAAARTGDTERIRSLMAGGADPNLGSGVNGWTPLMHAIHKNQPQSVEALLEGGAAVDARGDGGNTPLMMAAGYGYADIIRILLKHGADPTMAGREGMNSLDLAVLGVTDIDRWTLGNCQAPAIKALIEGSPDLKLHDTHAVRRQIETAKLKGCAVVAQLKFD